MSKYFHVFYIFKPTCILTLKFVSPLMNPHFSPVILYSSPQGRQTQSYIKHGDRCEEWDEISLTDPRGLRAGSLPVCTVLETLSQVYIQYNTTHRYRVYNIAEGDSLSSYTQAWLILSHNAWCWQPTSCPTWQLTLLHPKVWPWLFTGLHQSLVTLKPAVCSLVSPSVSGLLMIMTHLLTAMTLASSTISGNSLTLKPAVCSLVSPSVSGLLTIMTHLLTALTLASPTISGNTNACCVLPSFTMSGLLMKTIITHLLPAMTPASFRIPSK